MAKQRTCAVDSISNVANIARTHEATISVTAHSIIVAVIFISLALINICILQDNRSFNDVIVHYNHHVH